jgi:hypothetical protein
MCVRASRCRLFENEALHCVSVSAHRNFAVKCSNVFPFHTRTPPKKQQQNKKENKMNSRLFIPWMDSGRGVALPLSIR